MADKNLSNLIQPELNTCNSPLEIIESMGTNKRLCNRMTKFIRSTIAQISVTLFVVLLVLYVFTNNSSVVSTICHQTVCPCLSATANNGGNSNGLKQIQPVAVQNLSNLTYSQQRRKFSIEIAPPNRTHPKGPRDFLDLFHPHPRLTKK